MRLSTLFQFLGIQVSPAWRLGREMRRRSPRGGDQFYKKHYLRAKGFLLATLSTSILFIFFWIDTVRVLATTKNTSIVAALVCYTAVFGVVTQSSLKTRGTQRQLSENICSEDDLRSRIFGTFFVSCLPASPRIFQHLKNGIIAYF